MKDLATLFFVDSNHGRDLKSSKAIASMLDFSYSSLVNWERKYQVPVPVAACGSELHCLKVSVE